MPTVSFPAISPASFVGKDRTMGMLVFDVHAKIKLLLQRMDAVKQFVQEASIKK